MTAVIRSDLFVIYFVIFCNVLINALKTKKRKYFLLGKILKTYTAIFLIFKYSLFKTVSWNSENFNDINTTLGLFLFKKLILK